MAKRTTSSWRSSKKGTWRPGSLRIGCGRRGSRSGGTGGAITGEPPKGKAACSNLRPASPTHEFDVLGIELAGNRPELSGKRRDVAQHCPEMAGASGQDEEVPQSVEPEYSCQQVMPEPHPISWGNIFQGIPLLRTNRMPVRAARSSMRGLPPLGLGGSSGSSGSITSHSSSVRSSLAILSAYPLSSFVRRTKCIGARQASDRFVLRLSLPSSHCPPRKREARASTNPTIGN